MKISEAQTVFGDTECRSQRGQLDKISVRGEKSTTQQRKPYFIKQENKNVILGTKRFKKKKGMAGSEEKCKSSRGRDETGGLWYLCLPQNHAGTHTTPLPPTHS